MTQARHYYLSFAVAALLAAAISVMLPIHAHGQTGGSSAGVTSPAKEPAPADSSAGSSDERWRNILEMQLRSERQCVLGHYVSVRRFQLAGSEAIEGRVRCKDEREFDFSRPKVHMKFDIRLCQPAVC